MIFQDLLASGPSDSRNIGQKQGVSDSIEMLDAFRYGKINPPLTKMLGGLLIFQDLLANGPSDSRNIGQKHGVSASIEMLDAFRYGKINQPLTKMLEGWLIFPDLLANGWSDSTKSSENTAFPTQSKCLTHSATEKSTSR